MLTKAGLVLLLLGLIYGGYWVYRSPRVQQLLEPSEGEKANPLDFLENLPEPKVPPARAGRSPRSSVPRTTNRMQAAESPADTAQPEELPPNQVPNREVASVLMQILAAKKLAAGISLAVTDEQVILNGTVSPEKRAKILEIVDKGRESRRINDQNLETKEP